ncbi:MAG TPA: adenylate/guanylate cyclase domain-containing protein, partial [Leptospiraceae bacterium]|nr:adenylate/guanylate cyclase domain-containing protein [Leptospiraceae bacterium]
IEGLLVSLDDSYKYAAFSGGQSEMQVDYRFVHDQVHNAAYTLLNDDHRRQNHLRIGRTLLANLPFAERDDRILEITHHFNQGRELILDAEERLRLIELNIQAGKKARDASAYEEALRLFGVAFDVLPPDAAEKHYDIYMQVHRDLGEINYILNDPKNADKYFSKILEKAKSPLEKVRVYELKIAMSAGRGERAEAIRLGLEVLGLLGVKLTSSPSASSVKAELGAADKSLSGKNPDRLVDLHLMEEESNKAAMRVLMQIATPAFAGNAPLFYSIIARMIQLSTKHGNAPASAYAYAAYGMILCGDGESERGYRIGRMALDLVEKLQARDLKCRVYFLYSAGVHHWKQHARESTDYLTHAYQAGLESGDLEYVAAVIFLLTASALWVGHKPLKEVLSDFDRFANPLYRTGQKQVIQLVQMGRQYISNLQGGSRNRTRLSGERFHEEETAEFWKETRYGDGLYYLNLFKTSLADMFGQYDQALDFARKAEENGELQKATLSHPALELHRGLSAGALAGQPKADRKKLLEAFDASMSRIESFAKNSPDNFKHMHLMLRAERARLDARHGDAIPLYDEAIETARSQGFHLDEAHANELAASYFTGLGQRKFALLYVREARAIYGALDITAKVEEIENHFPELVRGSQMSGSGGLAQAGGFDFQTIVKAAASISGEIQLEGLLGKLLRIVMENAGAQKAHLLLDQEGAVVVSAAGNALTDQVTPVPNVPLEDYNLLPHSIVLLAERTRTSIVVDEAASDSRFRADPYILEYKPRSVLCMPVVLQGKLSCILYLENNGAPGVFSPARLEALQVLSAQIATSLENAKLYSNLERALEQEKLARQAQVEINEAISRFVPSEFLKLLGKENIVGVSLGDNIAREMTVLFSDIRSFTSLSESMTPEQNFRFINSYLNQVGPVVREHHGFIDKYIGDAIMALFDSPDNALMSSIGMLRALEVWNHGRLSAGYAPVRTGIGLHTGDLMLGTIGEKSRMEGTVISDHVNLASRMEGLTKIYGTSLIISNRTQSLLKDPSRFSFRTLDRVQVKGKKEPVIVIEVLDGETDSVRQLKEASRAKFDEAQKLYLSQKFENARSLFIEVLKSNPDDRAAGIFVRRCRLYMEKGVPEGWNGVEQMTTK